MKPKIYHQCGHHSKWNIDSFKEDHCGDGLILSPVHQKMAEVRGLSDLSEKLVFDPQYYLPNSQKKKLKTYNFFPETIMGGFLTEDFPLVALEAARECINFQLTMDFEKIIIPARYFNQMDPDFTKKQDSYTVHPFLKALQEKNITKPIFLTLPVTSHMITSSTYRKTLLNWATSYHEFSGIYLCIDKGENEKQVLSKKLIVCCLDLITSLKDADLDVLVGYCNTEGLIYLLAGDVDITFGSYENTRMFSVDKFVVTDEERRGPKPRIYVSSLLNWIQFNSAKDIKKENANLWDKIYNGNKTEYADQTFQQATEPTFNQPPLYKHHFLAFNRQFQELNKLDRIGRYETLKKWILNAIELNKSIERLPYLLDQHSKGGHLPNWLEAINEYFERYLKD